MPTKLRNNIKKKVSEHKRRLRKEARKLSALGVKSSSSSKSKELHIPNLYPFKKKMIEHIQNSKKTEESEKLLRKLENKQK
jgi:nuclear GTP-binding protein